MRTTDGPPGTVAEVFVSFLRLGVTAFGGPVAHLGFFRAEFVERRQWLSDRAYGDLVALCQFLPGPASSQVGMAVGLQRAGIRGLLAAWFAFTMPSALLLVAFAIGLASIGDVAGAGWLLGLKAAAVAVVAQAVLGMAKNLTPDARRATIAAAAMVTLLLVPNPVVQVLVIVASGLVGLAWLRSEPSDDEPEPRAVPPVTRRAGLVALGVFGVLLAALPVIASATGDATVRLGDVFYRSGSLVFGGGHVVLPMLESETVATGLVTHDSFLAGYGAAQAVPGPLFTFAGFLGASTTSGPTGVLGAAIALVAIFLPAALLVVGVLPFWERLRHVRLVRTALMGVNAAVVGILAAALYDPVFTQGVISPGTMALAVAAFVALTAWRAPSWLVVAAAALIGWAFL